MIENFLRHLNHVVLCLPEEKRKKQNQKTEGKLVVLRLVLGRVLSGSPLSSSLPICVQVYWLFVLFEQMPQTKTG